jgi:hypothetical protein
MSRIEDVDAHRHRVAELGLLVVVAQRPVLVAHDDSQVEAHAALADRDRRRCGALGVQVD